MQGSPSTIYMAIEKVTVQIRQTLKRRNLTKTFESTVSLSTAIEHVTVQNRQTLNQSAKKSLSMAIEHVMVQKPPDS